MNKVVRDLKAAREIVDHIKVALCAEPDFLPRLSDNDITLLGVKLGNAAKAILKSRWTSVEKSLPDDESEYRVYAEESTDFPECHAHYDLHECEWIEVLTGTVLSGITHWSEVDRPAGEN